MKQFKNHLIGVDQGEEILFTDFQDDGPMWTGSGPREQRTPVAFSRSFRNPPVVHVSVSLWDVNTDHAMRAEIVAEDVTAASFTIVFRTWADSRVARIRASWMAIGEIPYEDDWLID